jgi:hypothetical protein
MKFRYQTQAILHLGFWLIETRPVLFFIFIFLVMSSGFKWLNTTLHASPHSLRVEAFGAVVESRRENLL